MLDLRKYPSLGAALRAALDRWPDDVCLIEADRERENCRLTYRQFKEAALPLARALQDSGFTAGSRAAIIMTNQWKWLISAYAILYCGGVLVPLDYKLTAPEHLQLLAHSKADILIAEYHLWRPITQSEGFAKSGLKTAIVTEVPANAELHGAKRWEEFRKTGDPVFVERARNDWASIVYSSGTGGRPKGCVMTHGNYLEQCGALTSLFPFWPGVRYLSILPTNHAIDFMIGFIGPFVCGATVVHLRTLRPEFIRDAFTRYHITYVTLVPMILKSLERAMRLRFDALPAPRRRMLGRLIALNRACTRRRPHLRLSRLLLANVHQAFGGQLRAIFVGGAFTEPATLQFFYDLGIPVGNGYGLTEAGTVITLNDFKPFRSDTVGKPLPGTEVRIMNPDAEGVGEVAARSKTIMSHYLDDSEMTAATIVDGWLMTGDLGRIDAMGHLQLFGRRKNMIVTAGGKNIYPEDIERAFEGISVKEFCIFAANYVWPQRTMTGEQLVLVMRFDDAAQFADVLRSQVAERNRLLPDFKRVSGMLVWRRDFPRTASLKIKRDVLAEEIRGSMDRSAMVSV
ncbi:MAG TPA: AMP-binding protein [Candidatus Limnocylindrales bacterium]|nr:AMP-binding protein [Candidatus Limnocylindrales bacterium]